MDAEHPPKKMKHTLVIAMLVSSAWAYAASLDVLVYPYNDGGNFKVELFERGAATPTKVANIFTTNYFLFTWRDIPEKYGPWWFQKRAYFVRLTKAGKSNQTKAFVFDSSSAKIDLRWNHPNLQPSWWNLSFVE